MEPPQKEERNSFFDNERFEKFYQEFYKKVSEEVEAHACTTSDEEDYPMRFPAKRKFEDAQSHTVQQNLAGQSTLTQRPDEASVAATPDEDYPIRASSVGQGEGCTLTIEAVTGEDEHQNLAGPSTSTQRPDEASVAATPDEDYPIRESAVGKVEVCTLTIKAVTGEDEQQNLPGPSTSTQRPDEATFTPICPKQAIDLPTTLPTEQYEGVQRQAVDIKKCLNILPGQCEVVFAEEGTFVPSRDLNDTVVRFMKPNNFWSKMHIGPPRTNSKFHFYLVAQDRLPATETTNNNLAGISNVMVAIRQAILRKNGLTHIKNLARLTISQYISAECGNSDIHSISWENSITNDPIECEVMCVEKMPFNPFTRNGRIKSDALWKEITTSLGATTTTSPTEETTTKGLHDHELHVPIADFKPLPTSTPLAEKMFFDAAVDNRHEDKPDFLVISKFVYVIPRITYKQPNNKKGDGSQPVSEAVSEQEEENKIPEVSHIQEQLRRPVSGNNFAENQIVEIPIQTYLVLTTSSERERYESDLGKLAEVAQQRN